MDTTHPTLNDYTRRSIDIAARRLVGKGGFTLDDLDDIRGEITLYTLRQLPRHDPGKAKLSTFITVVVNHAACHVLRDQFADKRQLRRSAVSLDCLIDTGEEDEESTLEELTDGDEATIRLGYRNRSRFDHAILQFDLQSVMALLTDEQQACCLAIMDGRNPTEVAREQGIPRRTFRDRVLTPIRRAFKNAGLEDWR